MTQALPFQSQEYRDSEQLLGLGCRKAFLARVHTDELFSRYLVWLINLHLPSPLDRRIIALPVLLHTMGG